MSITEHIGEDGVFTETFAGEMKTMLGDDYAESKAIDEIKDLPSVFKIALDSRTKVSELGEQIKTLQQAGLTRPGESATDEEKATYRKTLQVELGASGKVEDYVVGKPNSWPEGLDFDEEAAKSLAGMFCEKGVPVDVAKGCITALMDAAATKHGADATAAQQVFDKAVEDINAKHQPDDLKVMGRQVVSFINLYGSDDDVVNGVSQKGMKTMVTEAGMFNTPEDFQKWKDLGVSPKDFLFMAKVGKEMDGGSHRIGSGGPANQEAVAEAETINAISGLSPGMQVPVPT